MAPKKKLSLRARLDSLTQEIYDEIYTLTFTPEASEAVVDNPSRPPKMSQIDAVSAKLYFSHCSFVGYVSDMVQWLQRLTYTPPMSNIRCYVMQQPEGMHGINHISPYEKAMMMAWKMEYAEEQFGPDSCEGLFICWSREEVSVTQLSAASSIAIDSELKFLTGTSHPWAILTCV